MHLVLLAPLVCFAPGCIYIQAWLAGSDGYEGHVCNMSNVVVLPEKPAMCDAYFKDILAGTREKLARSSTLLRTKKWQEGGCWAPAGPTRWPVCCVLSWPRASQTIGAGAGAGPPVRGPAREAGVHRARG